MFKNFRLNIIGRILFICISIFLLVILFQQSEFVSLIILLSSILLAQIILLIKYVESSNRDVTRFLDSIRYSDFSQSFSSKGFGSSFAELSSALTGVIGEFQKIRSEKEEHYQYIKTVIQHVAVGLIAYDSEGNVELINNAAKRFFGIAHLNNIKRLKVYSESLVNTLFTIKVGEKSLEKVYDHNNILQLIIYATSFKLKNKSITLVSIQNIESELEEKELEAWQKLIRVLTHEILNSMTPIVSLSGTAKDLLAESKNDSDVAAKSETIKDAQNAINTINKRSSGLLNFVEAFRRLYRLPQPEFKIFAIVDLVERCFKLMESEFKEKGISYSFKIVPQKLELAADPDLLEQVLLNLLRNSINALDNQDHPQINIDVGLDLRSRTEIKLTDNGHGIKPDSIDKIFIPFFTTKKEGSGIGLSLSKQILRLHKGSINVVSDSDTTTFILTF